MIHTHSNSCYFLHIVYACFFPFLSVFTYDLCLHLFLVENFKVFSLINFYTDYNSNIITTDYNSYPQIMFHYTFYCHYIITCMFNLKDLSEKSFFFFFLLFFHSQTFIDIALPQNFTGKYGLPVLMLSQLYSLNTIFNVSA